MRSNLSAASKSLWLIVSCHLPAMLAFTPVPVSIQHEGTPSTSSSLYSSKPSMVGKVVAQRFLYYLSPTQSSIKSPYALEQRQYYSVQEDNSLEPVGDRCFFLRGDAAVNPPVDPPEESVNKQGMLRRYTKLGSSLYKLHNVAEDNDDEELGSTLWDSTYALILQCMAQPEIIKGNGLELGCGVGVGGLLSCIGAGIASGTTIGGTAEDRYQSIEEIAEGPAEGEALPGLEKNEAPVSSLLRKITMTDSKESTLNQCFTNVKRSHFPSQKIEITELDWNNRIPERMRGKYDFILGSDLAYYFPLVTPLARTVAYSLQPSPYDRIDNEQLIGGRFVHVGPAHRETVDDLRRKLSRGYKMNVQTKELVLERLDLVPLILDSLLEEETHLQEEVEVQGGYVEFQNLEKSRFTSLVGHHNEDYDGFNGEGFFPTETGREDVYGSDGKEQEFGFGTEGAW